MNKVQRFSFGKRLHTPNVLILGVQKSATTTLFDSLKGYSGFSASAKKEIHFFDSDLNFNRGVEWYLSHFSQSIAPVTFEATPSYIYSSYAARRIYDTLEGTKFIVMLRDPVKRCLSAWNMFRNFNSDHNTAQYVYNNYIAQCDQESRLRLRDLLFSKPFPGFKQCVDDDLERWIESDAAEEPSFVRRGFYYGQIVNYLKYFKLEDFLFLEQAEYEQDPVSSINMISNFLGIEINVNPQNGTIKSNVGDYKYNYAREYNSTLLMLYRIYQKSNERLFSLLNRQFCWDSAWLVK